MPQFLLLFALAFVASAGRGIAADVADCQGFAIRVLVGATYDERLVGSCNVQAQCLNFKHFIEQHHKTVPGLTYAGAARAVPPAPKQLERVYGDACAWAAAGLTTGTWLGNRAELIALCNQNPDKSNCRSTRDFIEQYLQTTFGDLTCE